MAIFSGIGQSVSLFYRRLGNVAFVSILIFIAAYVWLNGAAWFPDWEAGYGQLIETYFVMLLIFLAVSSKQVYSKMSQDIQMPIWRAARSFVLFFFLTWGIMECLIIAGLLSVPTDFDMNLFWQTILLQVCVVATAEEIMFRGVVLVMLERAFKSPLIGIVGSSIIFALWHLWAYQIILYQESIGSMNWPALIIVFVIGLILAIIARIKEWGLPATIACHAVYNLMVVGALVVIIL